MVVRGGHDCRWRGGGWFLIDFMACSVKNKERVGIQGVHSVLGCTESCGNTSGKKAFKTICYNYVAIMNS